MLYFKLQELVDRVTFEKEGNKAWNYFQSNALLALQNLREFFGVPFTINNWHIGGQFQFRGYRPAEYKGGAAHSQHRLGNAFDIDIKGYTAEEARKKIIENQGNPLLMKITRMEDKVNWVHIDCRPLPDSIKRIHLFKA